MSKASFAATCIVCYCKVTWPDDYIKMSSTIASDWCDRFEGYSGGGSHKYINDVEEINKRIGARDGAGVYGYCRFDDGSSILLTCEQGIAILDEQGLRLKR